MTWNGTSWDAQPAATDNWGAQVAQTTGALQGTGVAGNELDLIDGAAVGDILKWSGTAWTLQADENTTYSAAGGGISLAANTFTVDNLNAIWNANQLQGEDISATAPTDGQVLTYNNSTTQWEAQTPSGDTDWTEGGGNVYRTSGNVGIGVVPNSAPLQVEQDINGGLMNFENRNTTGAAFQAGRTGYYMDVATTGIEAVFGSQVKVRSDNTGTKYGMDIEVAGTDGDKRGISTLVSGAGGTNSYGQYITNISTAPSNYGTRASVSGASTTNIALYGSAQNATNNYGLYVADGQSFFRAMSASVFHHPPLSCISTAR